MRDGGWGGVPTYIGIYEDCLKKVHGLNKIWIKLFSPVFTGENVFPGPGADWVTWFSFALWLITAKQNVPQRGFPDLQRFAEVLRIFADDPASFRPQKKIVFVWFTDGTALTKMEPALDLLKGWDYWYVRE